MTNINHTNNHTNTNNKKGEMKMKYYYQNEGECVNQTYAIEASSFNEALEKALYKLNIGDIVAEFEDGAIAEIKNPVYNEYHDLNMEETTQYAKLCKGIWEQDEWLEDVVYWEYNDNIDNFDIIENY